MTALVVAPGANGDGTVAAILLGLLALVLLGVGVWTAVTFVRRQKAEDE